jgi:hypothetical protein
MSVFHTCIIANARIDIDVRCISLYLSIYLSLYRSIYHSIYLSTYIYIYIYTSGLWLPRAITRACPCCLERSQHHCVVHGARPRHRAQTRPALSGESSGYARISAGQSNARRAPRGHWCACDGIDARAPRDDLCEYTGSASCRDGRTCI